MAYKWRCAVRVPTEAGIKALEDKGITLELPDDRGPYAVAWIYEPEGGSCHTIAPAPWRVFDPEGERMVESPDGLGCVIVIDNEGMVIAMVGITSPWVRIFEAKPVPQDVSVTMVD